MAPRKANKKTAKKTTKRTTGIFQYSEQQMMLAIEEVRQQQISVREAAKKFNVPKTTLNNKARGFYPTARKMGPKTTLDKPIENKIVKCLFTLAEAGFPLSKAQLLDNVSILMSQQKINPFKNGRPGNTWFKLFCTRHPTVTTRVAQNISRSRQEIRSRLLSNALVKC